MTKSIVDQALRIQQDLPCAQSVEKVVAALGNEGFGVLMETDAQATHQEKLDIDFHRHAILGSSNPPLAYRALSTEPDIGLLPSCNVIVYEEDGGSTLSISDPISMLDVVQKPDLKPVARETRARLERVVKALGR